MTNNDERLSARTDFGETPNDEFTTKVDERLLAALKAWPFLAEQFVFTPADGSKAISFQPKRYLNIEDLNRILWFLLSNKKIWKAIAAEIDSAGRKRGAPRKNRDDSKHSPKRLVELAQAFAPFVERERRDAHRRGTPIRTQEQLVRSFREREGKRFPWLPARDRTAAKIVAGALKAFTEGRFAKIEVNGDEHVLPAIAALATRNFIRTGHLALADQTLQLRGDGRYDDARMRNAWQRSINYCRARRREGIELTPGPVVLRLRPERNRHE